MPCKKAGWEPQRGKPYLTKRLRSYEKDPHPGSGVRHGAVAVELRRIVLCYTGSAFTGGAILQPHFLAWRRQGFPVLPPSLHPVDCPFVVLEPLPGAVLIGRCKSWAGNGPGVRPYRNPAFDVDNLQRHQRVSVDGPVLVRLWFRPGGGSGADLQPDEPLVLVKEDTTAHAGCFGNGLFPSLGLDGRKVLGIFII